MPTPPLRRVASGCSLTGVEEFAHQPKGFGDGAQGGVAAKRGGGGAESRHRGSQGEVVDDGAAPERHADTVRQLHVRGVQGDQQAACQ